MFSSGPDSPLSLMFGQVQEEEKWILVRTTGGGFSLPHRNRDLKIKVLKLFKYISSHNCFWWKEQQQKCFGLFVTKLQSFILTVRFVRFPEFPLYLRKTPSSIEFFLNVVTEFAEFSDKNICHYSKRAQTCHPATSCVRDQDATTAPARQLSPIHASVIYQIPWIRWIQWIPVPFRENSNVTSASKLSQPFQGEATRLIA